jgi:hypothetical protein
MHKKTGRPISEGCRQFFFKPQQDLQPYALGLSEDKIGMWLNSALTLLI